MRPRSSVPSRPGRDLWIKAESSLRRSGVANARQEALWLLERALRSCGAEKDLWIRGEELPRNIERELHGLIRSRARRVPLAYVLGSEFFMGLEFKVSPAVLVPRPETETLVRSSGESLRETEFPRVLEIGTGSGIVAILLARHHPRARITATDLSAAALGVARENAVRFGVERQIEFLSGDLYEPLDAVPGKGLSFDLIASNPPYVASAELERLEPEVRAEPRLALDGGPEGLDVLNRIIEGAGTWLRPGGTLALEIGAHQGRAVSEEMRAAGFVSIRISPDEGGRDRLVQGEKAL